MRVSGMTGSATLFPALKALTIGEHPSACTTASLGIWSISPMFSISWKPWYTPKGPRPPLTDWIYQSGARQPNCSTIS